MDSNTDPELYAVELEVQGMELRTVVTDQSPVTTDVVVLTDRIEVSDNEVNKDEDDADEKDTTRTCSQNVAVRTSAELAQGRVNLSSDDKVWLANLRSKKMLDASAIVIDVAARGVNKEIRVLKIYPLRKADHGVKHGSAAGGGSLKKWMNESATPWPNLYWLVDTTDQQRVGRLEHLGYVKKYRERLLNDKQALSQFERDHAGYARTRWALLTDVDRAYAEDCGYAKVLRDTGIGGVSYVPQVKCLHAHYCHWLATKKNIVGGWVDAALKQGLDQQSKGMNPQQEHEKQVQQQQQPQQQQQQQQHHHQHQQQQQQQ